MSVFKEPVTYEEKIAHFRRFLGEYMYNRIFSAQKMAEISELIKQTWPRETFETMLEKIVEEAGKPMPNKEFVKNVNVSLLKMTRLGLSLEAYTYLYEWTYTALETHGIDEYGGISRSETFGVFMKKTLEVKAA